MMFWSKTKDIVHDYTERNEACFVTLEDTLLGSVVNDLTWCGKEGSTGEKTSGMKGHFSTAHRYSHSQSLSQPESFLLSKSPCLF